MAVVAGAGTGAGTGTAVEPGVVTATGDDAAPVIDVHHHFRAPDSLAARPQWSAAESLTQLDRNGITAALGYAGPVDLGADQARAAGEQTRRINEFSAEVVRANPHRYGQLASLPMLAPDAALEEIAYAADQLEVDGFGIATCYGDLWLGEARFRPIWEELDRRSAVVFVHPVDCACNRLGYEGDLVTGPWLEWPANTARTILSLMLAHVFTDFPRIRFLFCHGGGVMPLLVNRISDFTAWPAVGPDRLAEAFGEPIGDQFARLHFEMAQACAPANLLALRSLVPMSQLMFGSDWDNFELQHGVERAAALDLDPADRTALLSGNALRLFPGLARRMRG